MMTIFTGIGGGRKLDRNHNKLILRLLYKHHNNPCCGLDQVSYSKDAMGDRLSCVSLCQFPRAMVEQAMPEFAEKCRIKSRC